MSDDSGKKAASRPTAISDHRPSRMTLEPGALNRARRAKPVLKRKARVARRPGIHHPTGELSIYKGEGYIHLLNQKRTFVAHLPLPTSHIGTTRSLNDAIGNLAVCPQCGRTGRILFPNEPTASSELCITCTAPSRLEWWAKWTAKKSKKASSKRKEPLKRSVPLSEIQL